METYSILQRLIALDTVSRNSNMALMDYVQATLASVGIKSTLIPNEDGAKANLYATIGPADVGGVLLSGHTDVVPVDGQDWQMPPFSLTEQDGRYFGRGTTDMKGFVACAMAAAIKAAGRPLRAPIHLGFSYDEEIGCQGVRSMIDMLQAMPVKPAMCIVGEPTSMTVATGHKGKVALQAECIGRDGHSALAPFAMNALHLGCDLVQILRDVQAELQAGAVQDTDYDVPYITVHVARMQGGVALNIVPNLCVVDFEIRNLAEDDPQVILADIQARAQKVAETARARAPEADIRITPSFSYPGLNTAHNANVVQFVKSLTGSNSTCKVAFGTEGGLFDSVVGVPTVVCGPGSMDQGHKADEYVEVSQIARCDAMLDALIDRLCDGL